MPSDLDLLIDMGFPQNRAEKAIFNTNHKGLQPAIDWLVEHEDDPDIDVPYEKPKGQTLGSNTDADSEQSGNENGGTPTAKSLKCDDCGKLLPTPDDIQMHAARTGHASFSESTDEIKPLTEEEKNAQLLQLQERLRKKKLEKEAEEKREQLEREKSRRVQGKNLSQAKAKFEEDEMKRLAEQRRREKEEERLYKQKLKEDIARDRAEKSAKVAEESGKTDNPPSAVSSNTAPVPTQNQKNHDKCRLQIRLTNGQAITESFGAKEPLSAVRHFIQMRRTDGDEPFKLLTNFPKRIFTNEDMEAPLNALGLCPSAVLIVQRGLPSLD